MKDEGTYANEIQFYLKDRGKTAKAVAMELGVSLRMLSYYQHGRVAMPVEYRQRLATLLEAPVDEIFPRNIPPEHRPSSSAPSIERVSNEQRSLVICVENIASVSRSKEVLVVPAAIPSIEDNGSIDWPTWFGQRTSIIHDLVAYWTGSERSYHHLQWTLHQEMDIWNTMTQQHQQTGNVITISRRTALATLAMLSTGLLTAVRGDRPASSVIDAFLAQCTTSITSCWHLLLGDGLATVEYAVPQYLPLLETLARQPGKYQKPAAYLAAQGCLLMGLVAMHRMRLSVRLAYSQRAAQYCTIADDPILSVATLSYLACTHYLLNEWPQSIQTYEQAMTVIATNQQTISLLLQSRVFTQAAPAYAQAGQAQQAFRCLGTAMDLFPAQPDPGQDPCFITNDYADAMASLSLWQGITYFHLGQHATKQGRQPSKLFQQACQSLASGETTSQSAVIPERLRVEILNHQTATAIAQRDLQRFSTYFMQGVQGAKALGSEKRRREATANWKAAKAAWPGEASVSDLVEILL